MNKKVLSMLLSAAAIITVQARHLSPDEALSRVINHQTFQSGNLKMAPAINQNTNLIYSADIDQQPMAYVFTNTDERGFMVVSADDVAAPLLGYSDNTTFDPENIPSNFKAWLDGYARQISYAANNAAFAGTPAVASGRTERAAVAPKLTTTWDQDAPYWNDCPTLNGTRCYTGCVATAMAQLMNYHKWPEQGQGSITYKWVSGNQSLSCNFSEMTFQWDKMLDNYKDNSPAENCAAVALLMKACGYASQMQYTPYASGTTGFDAAEGFIKYFNYDKSLTIQYREWYNTAEWEDLVYNELTTNGPVYYDGSGSDGGHAFVCDGYRGEGYFHFNWGWGGISDGYFLLTALNPGSQGAGGNTSGFNYGQSIMQNLSKPNSGSSPGAIIVANNGFTTSTKSTTLGRSVIFTPTDNGGGFYSFSVLPISNVTIGVKTVNNATGKVTHLTSFSNLSIEPLHGISQIPVNLSYVLTEGTYTVTPAYRVGAGEWQNMKTEASYNNALTMTIKGTEVTFSEVGAEASVAATDLRLLNDITATGEFSVSMKLTCSGKRDFIGLVQARFLNSTGTVVDCGEAYNLIMSPDETMNVVYKSKPINGTLHDGYYSLRFYSLTSQQYISEPLKVTVANPLTFDCSKLRVSGASAVDCNNVTISATVTCESGNYTGPLAFIASSSSEEFNPVGMFLSEEMTFSTNESKSVSFSGVFQEGEVGRYYYAALAYKGNDGNYHQIGTATVRFKVSTASGIDDIMTDQTPGSAVIYPNPAESVATLKSPLDIRAVDVYSLSGARLNVSALIENRQATLDVSSLPAGTYIVVTTGTDASRHTVKLIKR